MTDRTLEIEDVDAGYGESQVLEGVSIDVSTDEVVAILGRNGAGKTTTLRSVMGIVSPSSGTIRFQGDDITNDETYRISNRGVGYVPEDRRIFSKLTVEEHIVMGVDREYRSIEEELELAYNRFPVLEELRAQEGGNLSGGEQQMLAIARAMVGPTDLLLLDEPSEGLAPKIVQDIFRIVNELKRMEIGILVVEQNFSFARHLADRYYIMDNGIVKHEGRMEALVDDQELLESHLGVSSI